MMVSADEVQKRLGEAMYKAIAKGAWPHATAQCFIEFRNWLYDHTDEYAEWKKRLEDKK